VIGPARHSVLDYSVAARFFTLGATIPEVQSRSCHAGVLNGAMVLGMSLFTDYPGGVWRKISFRTHGALDIGQAAFAGLGPVLFGFAGDPEARTFYAQAVSEAGVVAATDWNDTAAANA